MSTSDIHFFFKITKHRDQLLITTDIKAIVCINTLTEFC